MNSTFFCEQCKDFILGEPWVSSDSRGYYFTCTPQCKERLERSLERERTNQRCLALGKAVWNGN